MAQDHHDFWRVSLSLASHLDLALRDSWLHQENHRT
jgi:hypothetical protein